MFNIQEKNDRDNFSLSFIMAILIFMPFYSEHKYIYASLFLLYVLMNLLFFKISFDKNDNKLLLAVLYSFIISLFTYNFAVYHSSISWIILSLFFICFNKTTDVKNLAILLVGISVFFSLDTILQFIYGEDVLGNPLAFSGRATGPFMWTSPVIGNYIMALFFVPEIIFKDYRIKIPIYILFFIAIILAGTRGALIQVLFCLFFIYVNIKGKLFFLTLASIFCLFIAPIIIPHIHNDGISRVLQLADVVNAFKYEARPDGRFVFWHDYLPGMIEHYGFIGSGLGGLEDYLSSVGASQIHPHHLYLELWLSFGVVGATLIILYLRKLYLDGDNVSKLILLSFWGPFNALHSIFDFYWAIMLFINLSVVVIYNNHIKKGGNPR
ncbi:O-antigen ligase family protein [Vibrio tritonius]|uniref:O-antigen ligase family protein n=1 Tax=Vibrio tritonius TaxID=1435069 RepID=A0ABS7YL37_9VIBR|nr:O-antigen ligase family protein [Vibrio tritonius]MCA2015712.1 O-antigen ligase family protein [Vibrio tritonius]